MENIKDYIGEWLCNGRKVLVFLDRHSLLRAYDWAQHERLLAVNVVWSGSKVSNEIPAGIEERWLHAPWADE